MTQPEPPFVISGAHRPLRYDYNVVRLWETSPEQVLSLTVPDLWPLAVVMGTPSVEEAPRIAKRIASYVAAPSNS